MSDDADLEPPRRRQRAASPSSLAIGSHDANAIGRAAHHHINADQNAELDFAIAASRLTAASLLNDRQPVWTSLAAAAGLSFLSVARYAEPYPTWPQPHTDQSPSLATCRRSLLRRGYCRLPTLPASTLTSSHQPHLSLPAALQNRIARACCTFRRLGWHLAFLLLYDEPWLLARAYAPVLSYMSYGRLVPIPDFAFFHVSPGQRGWGPHRDRPTMPLLPPDNFPAYLTLWLALTPATPESSCIYVVPADMDPLYGGADCCTRRARVRGAGGGEEREGGDGQWTAGGGEDVRARSNVCASAGGAGLAAGSPTHEAQEDSTEDDGMGRGLQGGEGQEGEEVSGLADVAVTDPQAVRALPAAAGEALVWSGRLLHWGSVADGVEQDEGEGEGDQECEVKDQRQEDEEGDVDTAPGCFDGSRVASDGAAGGVGRAAGGELRRERERSSGARGARVAMSFAVASPPFEDPLLRGVDMRAAELPSLAQRLRLVAVQIAVHEHQEPMGPELRALLSLIEQCFRQSKDL